MNSALPSRPRLLFLGLIAALTLTVGCSGDVASVHYDVRDPGPAPIDPPSFVDGGLPDGGLDRVDMPGRDDDRAAVGADRLAGSDRRYEQHCQGTHDDLCQEGYVCCHNTMRCVPQDCRECCTNEDYFRNPDVDRPPLETLPSPTLVGPPEGTDVRATPPVIPASAAGSTEGPMPTGPGFGDPNLSGSGPDVPSPVDPTS